MESPKAPSYPPLSSTSFYMAFHHLPHMILSLSYAGSFIITSQYAKTPQATNNLQQYPSLLEQRLHNWMTVTP